MIGAELGSAAAVVLGIVFCWAGAMKVVAPRATAVSFRQLGLPVAGALAFVVPAAELAIGASLAVGVGGSAFVALGLLVAFTVLLARVVLSGRTVTCACFGAARAEPVTMVDLVRNGLLGLLALAAAGADGGVPSLPALVIVSCVTVIGRVLLGVAVLARSGPLWPSEPLR